jgi:hypothetical protein
MKVYCKTTVFLFFFFSFRVAFSQVTSETRKEETIEKDTTINLLKETEINGNRIVVLFRNEDVTVQTSLALLESNKNRPLKEFETLDDSTLLKIFLSWKVSVAEVNAMKIEERRTISSQLEFLIADFIEKGQCWIIDNRTNLYFNDVEIQTFGYYRNEKAGYGGRQYLIRAKCFFRIIDFVI